MPSFDVHQHLWPEEVLAALSRRREPPLARRRGGIWEVQPVSEPSFTVDPGEHDQAARVELLDELGVDNSLVALSATIGVEQLPPAEAEPVIDAWTAASATLAAELRAGAGAGRDDADEVGLGAALDAGAAGGCLPAGALADPVLQGGVGHHLAL